MTVLHPLVSVIVPAYNEARRIRECLDSVLAQTYTNWECIVANNQSKDATSAIAHEYAAKDARVRVHENTEFLPAIGNFNHALRLMSPEAKYCKVVFADDWIYPTCIEEMVANAEAHPSAGIVGAYALSGSVVRWAGLPYPSPLVPGRQICRKLFLEDVYLCGAATNVLYRADLVRKKDPFYNEANYHCDLETAVQLLHESDFGFVHQVLSYTREEEEGCLRKTSEDLVTYIAGNYYAFNKYGRNVLTEEEFSRRTRYWRKEYYGVLAGGVLRGRGPKFWNYHKMTLAACGEILDYAYIVRILLGKAVWALVNPGSSIRRILQIASERRLRIRVSQQDDGALVHGQKPIQ